MPRKQTQSAQPARAYLRTRLSACLHWFVQHYKHHVALYWIAGIFIVVSFTYQELLLRQHSQYIFDLGMWNRHFWSLIHLDFGPNPLKGFNLLGDHAHFLLVLLAPFYAILPHVEFFFIVQSVAVGVAIFPLFAIARKYFNDWQSYLWILIFLLFFGFWGAFTYDFHEIIVAVPILAWLMYFYVFEKWRPLFILSMVLLLVREDMPLYVVAIGMALFLFKKRRAQGLVMIAISLVYFFWVTRMFMPWALGQPYSLSTTPLGSNIFDIAINSVRHPGLFVHTFFEPYVKDVTMLALFASFGFLSLFSPSGLLFLVPAFFARFLSVQTFRWGFVEHYSATQGALLFAAAMMGAGNIAMLVTRYWPKIKEANLKQWLTLSAFVLTTFADAVAQANYQTYSRLGDPGFYTRSAVVKSTDKAEALIPPDASVMASSSFARLTGRRDIYLWPGETDGSKMKLKLSTVKPDYIIVSLNLDAAYMPYTKAQLQQKIDYDKSLGYHQIFNEDGAIVLQKN